MAMIARAERTDTGDRFGIEARRLTDEALAAWRTLARVAREHGGGAEDLQVPKRLHRTIAGQRVLPVHEDRAPRNAEGRRGSRSGEDKLDESRATPRIA